MKEKIINNIKKNKVLYIILLVYIILSLITMHHLGVKYTLNSDDLSYVESGILFKETGRIGIHGYYKTAQIMPGMPILISVFVLLFGKGYLLWLALKIFWIAMATLSVYGLYKTIRLFANEWISGLITCFLFAADFLWMHSIILTETPFMLSFIFLIYHSLKLEKERKWKDFWFIVFWYIFGVMIRPNIGIYPLFLFFYLLIKKYDIKLILKQGVIAAVILSIALVPWTIRNYKVFNKLIPLTYGTGNPLLLGTYQGYNYPTDEELDYEQNVDNKISEEMYNDVFIDHNDVSAMAQYNRLEYDKIKADYRMKEWWKKDKKSMLYSYLVFKPKMMLRSSFYWKEIFNIPETLNLLLRNIDLVLTFISVFAVFILKKHRAEVVLLLSTYAFQIGLYSYTFAYSRYAQTLYFMRFIIIGIGFSLIYNKIKERKTRNETAA